MNSVAQRVVRLGLLVLACTACRQVPVRTTSLEAPTVRIAVGNLSDTELKRVERFFRAELPRNWVLVDVDTGGPPDAGLGAQQVPVDHDWVLALSRWEDIESLHRRLAMLMDDVEGHVILKNVRIDATLWYTSSAVGSTSEARIELAVTPVDAALFVDTPLPVEGVTPGRPVPTQDGVFVFRLPFAFIRRAERFVYFHSEYRGQYRYFRYDLERQRQELLEGVTDPAEFERYRAREAR